MEKCITKIIAPAEGGTKLGDYLRQKIGLTKAQIRRLKYQPGALLVNGNGQRVTCLLKAGDMVEIRMESGRTEEERLIPVDHELDILYEDEDVVCVWKPAGVVVHPVGCHKQDSIANYLAGYFRRKGETVQIRSIGRLDKDTSGVLVFAKSRVAAARLWRQKGQGIFQKEYLAVCEGDFLPEEYEKIHTIDMPIEKCPDYPGKMQVGSGGTRAVTRYLPMGNGRVKLWLETGRTHQIRVHMAAVGHSLVGDGLYGHGMRGETCAALCAYRAEFLQPFSNEKIVILKDRLEKLL